MKEFRKFLCLFLLQNLFFALYAGEISEYFSQYRLSNGMNVFVYEDFSSPTVMIQYNCKAGISCQTPSNAGFFPLYTELFKNAGKYSDRTNPVWLLDGMNSECNADSALYTVEASSSQVRDVFEQLSLSAFVPVFSDAELGAALDEAKKAVSRNAFSIEGFINSSIDSRVFSAAPWKHDSGIYPSLFKSRNLASSRFILSEISQKYYSPQNSSLFVTGAVSKDAVLSFAEETFGKYPPHSQSPSSTSPEAFCEPAEQEEGRRFVLSDPELSPDMAQAVVQFTGLSMEEADIASLLLNSRYSVLKQAFTREPSLNIRGADYINADAAHKNNSSRLIIQTLLEKSKMNYFSQCAIFEKVLKETLTSFSEEEFEDAKNILIQDFKKVIERPRSFMLLFSQFWAIDKNADTEAFLSRVEKIQNVSCAGLKKSLETEEPFFFFLLNSDTFKPLEKNFAASGFKSVTVKNGSWYTRKLYREIRDSAERGAAAKSGTPSSYPLYDKKFVQQTEENTHSAFLKNGIPVTAKINSQNPTALLALYIKGGEALTAKKMYAMESLAADTLALNIRKIAFEKKGQGLLQDYPIVTSETGDISSLVSVECSKDDLDIIIRCAGEALIYSQMFPSDIDSILADRRSELMIKGGTLSRQLYAAGIRTFYRNDLYRALYSSGQKDILSGMRYNDLLEYYTEFLDGNRLCLIASGNLDFDSLVREADAVFGNLNTSYKEDSVFAAPKAPSKNSQRVKLTHTFLTDISRDKAGPRPAVLIPTTDFSDPVQYWFAAPDSFSRQEPFTRAVFDAILLRLDAICKDIIKGDSRYSAMNCRVEENSPLVSFGQLTFFNVKFIADADALLQRALDLLETELSDSVLLDLIKSSWIKENYRNADLNLGAAIKIAGKIDRIRLDDSQSDGEFIPGEAFLEDYRSVSLATGEDFHSVFDRYFKAGACKFYSADSKK